MTKQAADTCLREALLEIYAQLGHQMALNLSEFKISTATWNYTDSTLTNGELFNGSSDDFKDIPTS